RHDPRAPGGEGMTAPGLPPVALLAGVDEVGRGPLAGDVVAAPVILDPARPIPGLADSKALSEKRREALYPLIVEGARAFHVARATGEEIDRLTILKATLRVLTRAVDGRGLELEFVVLVGNRLPPWRYPARPIVRGDGRVPALSAAGILAKVARDRGMPPLGALFPGYGFAAHKGYGNPD